MPQDQIPLPSEEPTQSRSKHLHKQVSETVTRPGAGASAPVAGAPEADTKSGVALLFIVASLFLLLVLPVVVRGAPLRDDFDVCLSPRWTSGPERMLAELWPEWGGVRLLGRFTEQSIIGDLCGAVPFGAIISIPLLTTFAVGFVLRGLLYDLGVPTPWPEIGTALWFLQPLGTEAALWPVALHIPLGLLLALTALRLYLRGRVALAALSGLAASWNLEQVLFALPLAVWVATPERHRRRATVVSSVVFLVLLTIFMRWPGVSTRTAVPLTDRVLAIVTDPLWYVRLPAVGTGAVSIPLAVRWAFPWSLLVLAVGSMLGVRYAPALIRQQSSGWRNDARLRFALAFAGLGVLICLPMMVTLPHEHGPRVFTPVWLLLAAFAAVGGSRIAWRRVRLAGALGGGFATGALLSLAFSVWVRLETADFTESASRWIGARVREGGRVVICDVPRTAVSPAPNGPFALHDFHEIWSAEGAIQYYTGRRVEVDRSGVYWDPNCANLLPADLVVSFEDLRRRWLSER
jgi:hypothetical protein